MYAVAVVYAIDIAMIMANPLERVYTFDMCKALVEACTPDNAQVDPYAARMIQKVSNGLALALVWFSKKKLVGSRAIINAQDKVRFQALAYANFQTAAGSNALSTISDDGTFRNISSDVASVKFFEKTLTLTVATAADSIVLVFTAMAKIKAVVNSYNIVVDNDTALALFFGCTLADMNASVKILFSKMAVSLEPDWELVEANPMT